MKASMAIGSSFSSGFSSNDDVQTSTCFHPKLLVVSKRDCLSPAMIAGCMNGALLVYVSFCHSDCIRYYPQCSAYCTHRSRARVNIHQLPFQPLDGFPGLRDITHITTLVLRLDHGHEFPLEVASEVVDTLRRLFALYTVRWIQSASTSSESNRQITYNPCECLEVTMIIRHPRNHALCTFQSPSTGE